VTLTPLQHASAGSRRREAAGQWQSELRRGFSLVELLVVVSIMVVLLGLVGAAVSSARASSKKQQAELVIEKLNVIVQQQFSSYASRAIRSVQSPAARSLALRRILSADMPDSWEDVRLIASGSGVAYTTVSGSSVRFPTSSSQRAYAAVLRGLANSKQIDANATAAELGAAYGDAECLFMIVMYGGFADCVECGTLRNVKKGDIDEDGAYEFLDEWNQPIRYALWPAKFELPPGTPFFATTSSDVPFLSTSGGRGMRPLIFSGGPDTTNSTAVNKSGNLMISGTFNSNCGNPSTIDLVGSLELTSGIDGRRDNITNFDAEVRK
jgi:prepilin-type N-terminal cleavage/methylation domain-containing protein